MKRKSINITQNLYNEIKSVKGTSMADRLRLLIAFYNTHSKHTIELIREEIGPIVENYMNRELKPYIERQLDKITYKAEELIEQRIKNSGV